MTKSVKYVLLTSILAVLFSPQIVLSATTIIDSDDNFLYLGDGFLHIVEYMINENSKRDMKSTIYKVNLKDHSINKFIKTINRISFYELSAKGYIAVVTTTLNKQETQAINELQIYDSRGQILKKINDVIAMNNEKFFSWSPDGNSISYITGEIIMEGKSAFNPSGVWIYNIPEGKTMKIAERGFHVEWSLHDDNIYIQSNFYFDKQTQISKYDTHTNILNKTKRKGMVFSDDGKYYIGRDESEIYDESGPIYFKYIFDSDNTKKILEKKDEDAWRNALNLQYKFIKGTHILLSWSLTGFSVINVDNNQVLKKVFKKGVIGWNKDMTKVVIYEGGDKIHIDELLTGKRLKSIEIPK